MAFLIKWSPPLKPNGVIKSYRLYRKRLTYEIAYDNNYNIKEQEFNKTLIVYEGVHTYYTDFNLRASSTYQYVVEVVTNTGSTLSESLHAKTITTPPTFLIKIGRLKRVSVNTATIELKPPLNLNGNLEKIVLDLISSNMINKVIIYNRLNSIPIDGITLLSILENVKIDKLKPNSAYEIRSIFCNVAGCLTSDDSLRFTTLDNDHIELFNVEIISPVRVDFYWNFSFGHKHEFNEIPRYLFSN